MVKPCVCVCVTEWERKALSRLNSVSRFTRVAYAGMARKNPNRKKPGKWYNV